MTPGKNWLAALNMTGMRGKRIATTLLFYSDTMSCGNAMDRVVIDRGRVVVDTDRVVVDTDGVVELKSGLGFESRLKACFLLSQTCLGLVSIVLRLVSFLAIGFAKYSSWFKRIKKCCVIYI